MSGRPTDIVVVAVARTPFGRFEGVLKDIDAPRLAALAINEALDRSGGNGHIGQGSGAEYDTARSRLECRLDLRVARDRSGGLHLNAESHDRPKHIEVAGLP